MKNETLSQFEELYHKITPAVENSPETFVWFTGLPHFSFNVVMRLSGKMNSETKVSQLIQQAPAHCPLSIWDHEENRTENLAEILKKHQFSLVMHCPLLALSPKNNAPKKPKMKIVRGKITTFCQIVADVFHLDDEVEKGWGTLLNQDSIENYLVYHQGIPAGTGTLVLNKNCGAIFNIAVLPSHQKKGLAKGMMEFLINRANKLGLEKLILLSGPDTALFYTALGFEKKLDIAIYASQG
ncbi:MAG: hypothetical protein CK425_02145 [Parachlamydia sp.]|nr:MAG: hypothetical protein CK425_02145 [Parachlamydia sp.]